MAATSDKRTSLVALIGRICAFTDNGVEKFAHVASWATEEDAWMSG